jgi:hypothetical protein
MRLLISLINACLILGLTVQTVAQTKKKKWQPATWKGLTTGKSKRSDVLKLVEGPVYQDDKGHAEFIEYRSKGIAVLVGYQDLVNNIEYLHSPPGLSSLKECPPDPTKRRGTKRKVKRVS